MIEVRSNLFRKGSIRIIEVSGPLHITFHMLKSIFIVYKVTMKWLQKVFGWKKTNVNKVSEHFYTCCQLCMITLEELERLVIDLFLADAGVYIYVLCRDRTLASGVLQ